MVITLAGHTGLNQRSIFALHIELRYSLPVVTWSTFLQKHMQVYVYTVLTDTEKHAHENIHGKTSIKY